MLLDAEQSTSTMFFGSTHKSSMAKVCDSLKGKFHKPGQWEGLSHVDSNLVLIEYHDFDANIKKKTVLSNAFVNSKKKPPAAAVPVFDEYKAAFAFCDKFNKGLLKQGGYLRFGDLSHQHNFVVCTAKCVQRLLSN